MHDDSRGWGIAQQHDDLDDLRSVLDVQPAEENAEAYRRAWALCGARRLLMALLLDALRCYQRGFLSQVHRKRRLFRETERWLMREGTGAAISFSEVCDGLGLDAERIQNRLRRWRAHQAASGGGDCTTDVSAPFANPRRLPIRSRRLAGGRES